MKKATFFARMKKLAMLALTSVMLVSALSVGAWAARYDVDNGIKSVNKGDVLYTSNANYNFDIQYRNYDGTLIFKGDGLLNPNTTGGGYVVFGYEKLFEMLDDSETDHIIPDTTKVFDHWDISWETTTINALKANNTIIFTAVAADDYAPIIAIRRPLVEISKKNVTGYVGGTLDLDYTYFNMTEPTAAWTSSDETVATVDADGIVTFVKKGEVTITLTVEGYGELKCNINIKGKGITKR